MHTIQNTLHNAYYSIDTIVSWADCLHGTLPGLTQPRPLPTFISSIFSPVSLYLYFVQNNLVALTYKLIAWHSKLKIPNFNLDPRSKALYRRNSWMCEVLAGGDEGGLALFLPINASVTAEHSGPLNWWYWESRGILPPSLFRHADPCKWTPLNGGQDKGRGWVV